MPEDVRRHLLRLHNLYRNEFRLNGRERKNDTVKVLTEHCRNIHIGEFLHDTADETIGCYVVRIQFLPLLQDILRSLLMLSAVLTKNHRVLPYLSPNQLLTVYSEVKYLLLFTVPFGCVDLEPSCFSNSPQPPDQCLWNWDATEADTLYAIGHIICHHTLLMQALQNYYDGCIVSYIPVEEKEYAAAHISLKAVTFSSNSYLSAVHTVSLSFL